MPGVSCPTCQANTFSRYRGPVDIADVTFRRHLCLNCKGLFLTAQIPLDMPLADRMLELMEQPTPSSAPTPNASALSLRTLLEKLRDEDSNATSEASA